MKTRTLIQCLVLFFLIFSTTVFCQKNENFNDFLYKFLTESKFQFSRIKFPLKLNEFNAKANKVENKTVAKNKWVFDDYKFVVDSYFIRVSDKFEENKFETGQRVLTITQDGSHMNISLYFQLIKEKWYLVKKENLGD